MLRDSPLATRGHLLARVLEETDEYMMAACSGLLVVRWNALPTVAGVAQWAKHLRELGELHPKLSLLTILGAGEASEPSSDAATQIEAIEVEFAGRVLAEAYVVAGTGFRSATMRSFVTSAQTGAQFPKRTFASLEGACGWLARRPEQIEDLNSPRRTFGAVAPSLGVDVSEA